MRITIEDEQLTIRHLAIKSNVGLSCWHCKQFADCRDNDPKHKSFPFRLQQATRTDIPVRHFDLVLKAAYLPGRKADTCCNHFEFKDGHTREFTETEKEFVAMDEDDPRFFDTWMNLL